MARTIDSLTLVFYGIVAVFVYGVIRQFSESHRVALKVRAQQEKREKGRMYIGEGIVGLLDNAPSIIDQLTKMKLQAQGRGATEDQLKGIQDRIGWMQTLQKFEIPIRVFSPVIDRVGDRAIVWVEKFLTG